MSAGSAVGFFGKLPARGDFVRAGLPSSFVNPWDSWLQAAIASARSTLGEAWLPAWMEAPVWRFLLAPGLCGDQAALGVWMPSVDRVGRHFPLTCACLGVDMAGLAATGAGFLAAAEDAGLDALAHDLDPAALMDRLAAAPEGGALPLETPQGAASVWWTDGAPRVPATGFSAPSLPDAACFLRMLDETAGGLPQMHDQGGPLSRGTDPDPFGPDEPRRDKFARDEG